MRGRKTNFFTDAAFETLRKVLDLEMKVFARNSIGFKPKQAEGRIPLGKIFWEVKILSTTFYLIGLNFGEEHRRLTINKCSVVEGFQNFPWSTVHRQQGRRKIKIV